MKIQKMDSTGKWQDIDEEKIDRYINQILDRETWLAERRNRQPMTTKEEVFQALADGQKLTYDDFWYAEIRGVDVEAPVAIEQTVEFVKCDCGHTVPAAQVMYASRGTSCPDCYDDWSN